MAVRRSKTGQVRIGISGWRYKGWRGVWYPPGLPQRRELEFAAGKFRSVEINGTFYSLQKPAFFRRWASETPDGFVFAVKGPRYVTHMLKLRHVERPLANFFASGLLELGAKLGPVLWQFPPQMRFDAARFAGFFDLLPRTLANAAAVARGHDARLEGRVTTELPAGVSGMTKIRHCVEIRHESFATPEFVALLRAHDIGLVVADTVAWPLLVDVTADFVYCRLHGSVELYASGYESEALEVWAERVTAWARGGHVPAGEQARRACSSDALARKFTGRARDVYVYFDNDAKVRAPFDALALEAKVRERLA